jgi:hypothetical protein
MLPSQKHSMLIFSKPVTQPYWLKEKMEEGYYHVADFKK